jgi:hypothetical protein
MSAVLSFLVPPSRAAAALAVSCLGVAACGGGGDAGPPAVSPVVTGSVTAANADATAAQAYRAASALYDSGSIAGSSVTGVVVTGGDVRFDLMKLASEQLLAFAARGPAAGRSVTGVVVSEVAPCPDGGQIAAVTDDADGNGELSTGDSGAFTFQGCVIAGTVINGSMSFGDVVLTGSDATPARSVGATVVFDGLTAQTGAELGTVDGDFTMQASRTNAAPVVLDVTVTGSRFDVSENARIASMSDFVATLRIDETAGTYVYGVTGTASGTGLPGAVALSTPTALAGTVGAFPSTGTLLARASNGTAVRITALSPTSASVGVDLDGDGAVDVESTRTWAQLAAL